ncbi:MAG: hypothetical protein IKW20_01605 [Bacteroidales bacterium]|nr:hypothetical protein [Bacteroidales bacterium]
MRICENGKYRDLTPEELEQARKAEALDRIRERSRPLTESDVVSMLLAQNIQSIEVDDNTALRMKGFYPEWEPGKTYEEKHKVTRNGKLYKIRQAHTAQAGWEPENATALFAEICETHDGTLEDPIPYDGNMALEMGKHYIQDDEIYICTRDTGNPVYHDLADLIGLYVEIV